MICEFKKWLFHKFTVMVPTRMLVLLLEVGLSSSQAFLRNLWQLLQKCRHKYIYFWQNCL
uniref:Uncharacterized protein n=1 Tax=Arundo donax TaxID=35708 RepID=A0A0A9GKQ9_ARUDO